MPNSCRVADYKRYNASPLPYYSAVNLRSNSADFWAESSAALHI